MNTIKQLRDLMQQATVEKSHYYVFSTLEKAINELEEITLMLDVFNSCIVTKTLPKKDSPCQVKIIELMRRNDREPTAKS